MLENIIEKRILNAIQLLHVSNKKTSIRAIAKLLGKENSLLSIQNVINKLITEGVLLRDENKQLQIMSDI